MDVEGHLDIGGIGIGGRGCGLRGRLVLQLLGGFGCLVLDLLEGHQGVGVLDHVDVGDGFLIEVDDLDGVGGDVSQAIAFQVDAGDDWLACLTRLRAEGASHFGQAEHRAAGELRDLLIAIVGERNRGQGEGETEGEQFMPASETH